MTIAEMHLAFDRVADLVATNGYPGLEPEEKDYYINRAIERFIKTRYSGNNYKRESFEVSQKRIEDLRALVVRNLNTNTAVSQTGTNEFIYVLPDGTVDPKYFIIVGCNVVIDKDACGNNVPGGRSIIARQMTHDQKEVFLDDPYHTPNYDECLYLFEGNAVYIYTNGLYDVLEFNMQYMTYPVLVDINGPVDCNLPDHTHQEIVDEAVRLFVSNIADQVRTQIENNSINLTE